MYADLIRNYKSQRIKSLWDNRVKKNPAEFEKLEKEYYQNIKNKNLSYNLCNYVWKVLVSMSKGYGFRILKPYMVTYS